ncbi:MAG: hypothetical protein ACLFPR_17125, partial [Desulfococcaceae bacterium]
KRNRNQTSKPGRAVGRLSRAQSTQGQPPKWTPAQKAFQDHEFSKNHANSHHPFFCGMLFRPPQTVPSSPFEGKH